MLSNCLYDKIKIIQKLSCTAWFIEKHAKDDAKIADDKELLAALEGIQKDLETHVETLKVLLNK